MGLDMYLYAEKRVDSYSYENHNGELTRRDNIEYDKVIKASGMDSLPSPSHFSDDVIVSKQVAYWRKANAIHGWIVRNLAGGVDDCERVYLDREALRTLRDCCVKELANRSEAVPNDPDNATLELEDSGNPEEVIKVIMEQISEQSANRSKTITLADPLELAPVSGFFFGSADKDKWYYEDLEYTVDTLNSLLAATTDEDYSFYYQASW